MRLHITRQVQSWLKGTDEVLQKEKLLKQEPSQEFLEDSEIERREDLGLIDFIDIAEERFEELGQIGKRLGKYTEELGERMNSRTKEIQDASTLSPNGIDRKIARRLMARAATDMDIYADRVEVEIPLFSQNLDEGMNAFIEATRLMGDIEITESDQSQSREALKAALTLVETLFTTEETMSEFRIVIVSLPRLTSELNKSKRRVIKVLDQLIEQMKICQRLATEAERTISERKK